MKFNANKLRSWGLRYLPATNQAKSGHMKNFQSEYNRPMLPSIGGLPIVS